MDVDLPGFNRVMTIYRSITSIISTGSIKNIIDWHRMTNAVLLGCLQLALTDRILPVQSKTVFNINTPPNQMPGLILVCTIQVPYLL